MRTWTLLLCSIVLTLLPGLAATATGSAPELGDTGIRHTRINAGQFVFDARVAGPEEGELVLLLHGFPQTSYSFRHQLEALGKAGYHAVAPDQRGYSPGARPNRVQDYAMGALVTDIAAIADSLGREDFHLVGHDWGGAVAWATATTFPGRVKSLAVLSTPHYAALQRALATPNSEQSKRSAYFRVFGASGAEDKFLENDAAYFRGLFAGGGLTPDEIQIYVDALGTPEAMRAALSWYAALNQSRTHTSAAPPPPIRPIQSRTLYVWSTEDTAFARSAAEATRDYVSGAYRFVVLEGISHWVPEQAASQVSALLIEHLAAAR